MYEHVLVPTDGAPGSERVVDHAAELAAATGGRVTLLTVVDAGGSVGAVGEAVAADVSDALAAGAEEVLEEAEAIVAGRGVPVETETRHGSPHREILDCAEEIGADAIVMGTHGRRGLERYLLGSVTERVLRLAEVPVVAVKLGEGRITDADDAERRARRALREAGDAPAELREQPHRDSATWIVPVTTADGRAANVHVDVETGQTRVAEIDA